ncbi:MAG: YecA family protein [Zetaproteobacteria bacterium CG06_land_8_20_14_3_00_59_53]|nr:MAG: YecA family protein [Zetaproteobacteria bacterium CG23_combo_of_CG06-09_8_20_14_all_59_86]PIQ65965.1 MAG: YecA family protein [Zetaproteobacteria bacterium CG11_big_fil_rev_8_21_14_0_20_59_439]PIU71445.1 MAG: YecA family protein [Zetaproteobacteria bacterium CG06_land_8_20_14_3_00_59_53]PIU97701.1 MAG: YecA family protein [Zetaproteobacteria bacterium CG03_land_8_20_14_0_80_59_51]PIY47272.1 MAG: YecA family protein [Zetaproteobacteria bacterium CG_4_10_14_0_8_um_filter_59_127]PJC16480.
MMSLFEPLDDTELDRLDDILLDHVPEDADTEGKDEGILDIQSLDGFLTAVVSAPNSVLPSQWLPKLWGDFEPVWKTMAEYQEFMNLIMRHLNCIAGMINEEPKNFEPLFGYREVDGKTFCVVDEWCYGYLRGMELDRDGWRETPEEILGELVGGLALFSTTEGWDELDERTDDEIASLQERIAPAVRKAHAYWLAQRAKARTVRRELAKVGRNDPCPCGSGKKFKKCCGVTPTFH